MLSPYEHDPLDLDQSTFRLLVLHPSQNGTDGPLFGSVIHASFNSEADFEDLLSYEALSYTWASANGDPGQIIIDGKGLAVAPNLYTALKALRRSTDRWLWIDAICINQANNNEKGHQVRQMGQIYEKAEKVIVWLGVPSIDALVAIKSLQQIENSMKPLRQKITAAEFDEHMSKCGDATSSAANGAELGWTLRMGVEELLQNSWFRRVWILQEVASARRTLVQTGNHVVNGRVFAYTPRLLRDHDRTYRPAHHVGQVLELLRGSRLRPSWWGCRDLYTLLKQFCAAEASDDRDRIYALLKMCDISKHTNGHQDARAIVDYNADIHHVLKNTISFAFPFPSHITPPKFESFNEFFQNIESLGASLLEVLLKTRHLKPAKELLHFLGPTSITAESFEFAAKDEDSCCESLRYLLRFHVGAVPVSPELLLRISILDSPVECVSLILNHSEESKKNLAASLYHFLHEKRVVHKTGFGLAPTEGRRLAILNFLMSEGVIRELLWSLILSGLCLSQEGVGDHSHSTAAKQARIVFNSLEYFSRNREIFDGVLGNLETDDNFDLWVPLFRSLDRNSFSNPAGHSKAQHSYWENSKNYRIKVLLDAGASPNVADGFGKTAFTHAILTGDVELMKILLTVTADINKVDGPYAKLYSRATFLFHGIVEDTFVDGSRGEIGNLLHLASLRGDADIVGMLLKAGADVNATGGHYGSALQAACVSGSYETVAILLAAGADVNHKSGALGCAIEAALGKADGAIISLLLRSGAKVLNHGSDLTQTVANNWL